MSWKIPQFSSWLKAYIVVGGVVSTVPFILIHWHNTGGNLHAGLLAYSEQMKLRGGTLAQWVVSALIAAGLLWFTFFSGSHIVTEDDKRIVRIMCIAGGASIAVWLARHL